jgi:hypothetical protein
MEHTIIVCYKTEVIFAVDLLNTLSVAYKSDSQKETKKEE